jgi:hypothetical protein
LDEPAAAAGEDGWPIDWKHGVADRHAAPGDRIARGGGQANKSKERGTRRVYKQSLGMGHFRVFSYFSMKKDNIKKKIGDKKRHQRRQSGVY